MALSNTVKGMSKRQKEKRRDLFGYTVEEKRARRKAMLEARKKRKRYSK